MIFFEDGDNPPPEADAEPERRLSKRRYAATNVAVFVASVVVAMAVIATLLVFRRPLLTALQVVGHAILRAVAGS
ncbi:hypothetical protein [Krasilnikovia sp. MM14-A1259]|uniref:hypothetical protein n=1 Tax=Krasilnikovia sp. MM14-A1259 TaxID=3373539 RepID=UPI00399CAE6A